MFDPDVCSRTGDNLLECEGKLIYLDNVAEEIVRSELALVCRHGSNKMTHYSLQQCMFIYLFNKSSSFVKSKNCNENKSVHHWIFYKSVFLKLIIFKIT